MRTQLSLLALVVAILAGQASAVTVSPVKELYKALKKDFNPEAKLSSAEVVSQLRQDGYGGIKVEELLYAAQDRSVEVCDQHTIGELLALNEVDENGKDDCTPEALDERAKYCSGLAKEDNQADDADVQKNTTACNNVHRFCVKNVEGVTKYCEKRKTLGSQKKVIEPEDPQRALNVLSSGDLDDGQVRDVIVLTKNKDVVVCNGVKLSNLYETLFERECSENRLKEKLNFCVSLKNDDDVACTNVNLYCRYQLGATVKLCINPLAPKEMVKLNEQTIKDLTNADIYKFVEDYGEHLRADFRKEMSPFEKIIAKF